MTYAGLSSPACMAAVLACSSVLPRTTLFGENSCGDTWGSQTWPTCIVPIVFSRLLFKSPPDLHFWLYENISIYENWFWESPGQPGCAQGREEVPSANKGSRELGDQHLQISRLHLKNFNITYYRGTHFHFSVGLAAAGQTHQVVTASELSAERGI